MRNKSKQDKGELVRFNFIEESDALRFLQSDSSNNRSNSRVSIHIRDNASSYSRDSNINRIDSNSSRSKHKKKNSRFDMDSVSGVPQYAGCVRDVHAVRDAVKMYNSEMFLSDMIGMRNVVLDIMKKGDEDWEQEGRGNIFNREGEAELGEKSVIESRKGLKQRGHSYCFSENDFTLNDGTVVDADQQKRQNEKKNKAMKKLKDIYKEKDMNRDKINKAKVLAKKKMLFSSTLQHFAPGRHTLD